jgi:lysozyme family protein
MGAFFEKLVSAFKAEVKPVESVVKPVEIHDEPKPVNYSSLGYSPETLALLKEYSNNYAKALIRPEWQASANNNAERIQANLGPYTIVADRVGNIPPIIVGCLHMMESSFSFNRHLHNGDLLTARTVNVPAGRPKTGKPPFTWSESAIDALYTDRVKSMKLWDLAHSLWFCEKFNGWGYRSKGILSPYLWSGTTLYTKGKYVSDGVFSNEAVSKQLGIAAVLKVLETKGFKL